MDSMLLAYAGPPLLGAFIGYLTNKIAIRMLFRPLQRWRIFSIRIPMTPGVIPSKRQELAKNIGEMVGTHLLTSRDIGAALSEERFQHHLNNLVEQRFDELLSRDLHTLPEMIPERFQSYFKVAVRTFKSRIHTGVHRYLESSEFEHQAAETISAQLHVFGNKRLNDLITGEKRLAFYGFIDNLVADILAGSETEDRLAAYLRNYLVQSAADGKTIADHLPDPLYTLILDIIRDYSPDILRQLARMMAEPPVMERIIKVVRNWVENFFKSLGPLGAMAGSFLDMNVLDERVRNYLYKNKENIVAWLQNPEVQERFSTVLIEQARKFLDKPLAEILDRAEDEQLEIVCREVSVQILAVLRSQGAQGAMSAMLRDHLEEVLGQGENTMKEIGRQLLSARTIKSLRLTMSEEVVALIRTPHVRKVLDRKLNSIFDGFLHKPIGILHDILPAGVQKAISDYAVLIINRILLREVPSLVEHLNIRRIVAEKVDSLDLLKLERLLLSIMEEQFKYINLFGALLGFLIGLVNVLVLQLIR